MASKNGTAVIIVSAIVIGGGIAVWLIFKNVSANPVDNTNNNTLPSSTNGTSTTNQDLNTLENNGINPSFQPGQYSIWANQIVTAFSGCDTTSVVLPWNYCEDPNNAICYSNSGAIVHQVIANFKNDADFVSLKSSFGTRTISKSWVCGGDYTNVDLLTAVSNQLNKGEISMLNSVLSANGITYKFNSSS
jgi:hypothetical protein